MVSGVDESGSLKRRIRSKLSILLQILVSIIWISCIIIISLHTLFLRGHESLRRYVRLAPIGSCATDLADLQEPLAPHYSHPKNEREGRDSAVTLQTEDGLM